MAKRVADHGGVDKYEQLMDWHLGRSDVSDESLAWVRDHDALVCKNATRTAHLKYEDFRVLPPCDCAKCVSRQCK